MLSNYEEVIVGLFKGDLVYKRSELLNSFSRVLNMDKSLAQHVLNRNLLKLLNKGLIIKERPGYYRLSDGTVTSGVVAILTTATHSINNIVNKNLESTLNAVLEGDNSVLFNYKYNKKICTILSKLTNCKDLKVLDSVIDTLG